MNNDLKKTILATEKRAQYDNAVKHLLSHKILLAHILVHTVDEFKDMNPEDVVDLIEGEPLIDQAYVEPGFTNSKEDIKELKSILNKVSDDNISEEVVEVIKRKLETIQFKSSTNEKIRGYNTEDYEPNEGYIRYDIIFYVMTKDGKSKIIINIEAQKNEPKEYNLLDRAIFYACRMISSQKEREFQNSDYNDLKKIYSIWICMNRKEACLDHISLKDEKKLGNYDWKGNLDLLNIVLIGLPKEVVKQEKYYELHRLLGTLLSMDMKANDKIEIVKDEYAIKFDEIMREEVDGMCNLSEGILERGIEIGEKRGRQQGIEIGLQTAARQTISMGIEFGLTEEDIITRLQQSLSITLEKAKEYLDEYKLSSEVSNS